MSIISRSNVLQKLNELKMFFDSIGGKIAVFYNLDFKTRHIGDIEWVKSHVNKLNTKHQRESLEWVPSNQQMKSASELTEIMKTGQTSALKAHASELLKPFMDSDQKIGKVIIQMHDYQV